jgi:hypothetical protein
VILLFLGFHGITEKRLEYSLFVLVPVDILHVMGFGAHRFTVRASEHLPGEVSALPLAPARCLPAAAFALPAECPLLAVRCPPLLPAAFHPRVLPHRPSFLCI